MDKVFDALIKFVKNNKYKLIAFHEYSEQDECPICIINDANKKVTYLYKDGEWK